MKRAVYQTQGTCSRLMTVTLSEDNKIVDVEVLGGCNGNLKGIRSLVIGQDADEVKQRLRGVLCRDKQTSCPDQLSYAIEKAQREGETV